MTWRRKGRPNVEPQHRPRWPAPPVSKDWEKPKLTEIPTRYISRTPIRCERGCCRSFHTALSKGHADLRATA